MFQTQAVSELMNRHPVQIYALNCSCCKLLVIVEMGVTRKT